MNYLSDKIFQKKTRNHNDPLVISSYECRRVSFRDKPLKAYDLADAEGEWNILHHARWGQFDSALNCARHQPGGRDAAMRTEPISEVKIEL